VAITGTPKAGNVAWTETDPHFTATNPPPSPRQPSGVPVTIQLDDRFLSAVWKAGNLWVSGNDACVPDGDTVTRSCLRLVEAATGATSSIVHDFDAGTSGVDLYFPAVTLNASGDLFVAYSKSSSIIYPSAAAVDGRASSPTTLENELIIAAGQASYLFGPNNRWGDYSAAATDPADPSKVWVTAEYQASAADPSDWGTATAELTILTRSPATQSGSGVPNPRPPANQSAPATPTPRSPAT